MKRAWEKDQELGSITVVVYGQHKTEGCKFCTETIGKSVLDYLSPAALEKEKADSITRAENALVEAGCEVIA